MSDLPQIIKVESVGAFALHVTFADGASGVWRPEVAHWRGPVAAPLQAAEYFARAFADQGAVAWPNGFDASPEAIRSELAAAGAIVLPTTVSN